MPTESNTLRVLLVAVRYFPYMGGLETHVYEIARRLAHRGVEVTVLTTDVSGRLPELEDADGVQIRRVGAWPAKKDYYFAPGIYRFITHGHWDLVHCQGYHNLVPPLAMLAAWRADIPYILTFHSGGDVSRLRGMLRGLQRTMLRPLLSRAQKLIAVSAFEATFFRERLRLPDEQFVIIPNGSHLPEVQQSTEGATHGADHDPLIVSIGRLERYKGHQRVIAALPRVQQQFPNARIRIAGAGPYEAALQKIARELGVAEHVEIRAVLPADREGMASLITRANLVTLLSQYEAQGIAVLEALALHRPVLVTGTSALQEFADRGLATAISLESTPEEVAMAIVDQLRQPLVPPNIELPTWDECAANLLALYQALLQGGSQDVTRRVSCVS
ncbi:MAG: glycosyltransferase family 4 protein [Ktedonobacteraceae bacterium]|nr:glycosyltransferase family 4 protein [Ktedonobacteraceae bacterium]